VEEEMTNPIVLGRKVTASRSNSPTKRSRVVADLDDDTERVPKRHRACEDASAPSSFDSGLQTLDSITGVGNTCRFSSTTSLHSENSEILDLYTGNVHFDELRGKALELQRPTGYVPDWPLYDKHRPAKEELEFMGVEILSSHDSDDSSDEKGPASLKISQ
jgi:hypothetical protein